MSKFLDHSCALVRTFHSSKQRTGGGLLVSLEMEGRDNSVPEGTVWIDLEALFRKKAQKNSKNRIAIAAEKLQWCVLEDDTLSYYEARPGTDHRPKESRLLGSYNMIQVIECTRQATAPTFSPKALRGFTLRFVGGKSVSLVPTSRKIDVDYWVSQINARRAFFRRQQEETHQLVERGIERITNISELKKELGVGKDELPLQCVIKIAHPHRRF